MTVTTGDAVTPGHLPAEDWPLGVCMLLGYKSVAVLTFEDHLNMRKLMTPAFNPKHLARGVPRLVELAEEHCRGWGQQGDVMGATAIKAFTFHVRGCFAPFASPLARRRLIADADVAGALPD